MKETKPEDYKKVLGQILHHIGVEIEFESIVVYGTEKEKGLVLNYIGQILKGHCNEEDKLREIASLLDIDINKTHILELAQILICANWKERIEEIKKR